MASTVTSGNAGIVSGLDTVYTIKDRAGNDRVEAWLTLEAQGIYVAGGLAYDLSPHFRNIVEIITGPISGSLLLGPMSGTPVFASGSLITAVPVRADYATPTSARFQLYSQNMISAGGIVELVSGNISGVRHFAHVLGY